MVFKRQQDFFAGLLFCAVGIAFAWAASLEPIGTSARMGPGFLPLALGVLLALVGMLTMFAGLAVEARDAAPIQGWAWRPMICVFGATLAFGWLIGGLPLLKLPPMGLAVSSFALVFVASFALRETRLRGAVVMAVVFSALSCVVCAALLQTPLPLWPASIGH